jgi:hypothetical protein
MFRRRFGAWSFLAAIFCVGAIGGFRLFWPKPKPKTFLDFPTQRLHATCWIRGLEYEVPEFLTADEINELKKIIRHSQKWVPDKKSRGNVGYITHDVEVHFFLDEENLDHYSFSGMDWVFQHTQDRRGGWFRIDRADYSEFLLHCHETYDKRHPELVEDAP